MQKAKITIHPDYRIGEIDRRLFGAFLEPIGSWIYGSIWNPRIPWRTIWDSAGISWR